MTWGTFFFVLGGLILFGIALDVLKGDVNWWAAAAGCGFFGIAFSGLALPNFTIGRREP